MATLTTVKNDALNTAVTTLDSANGTGESGIALAYKTAGQTLVQSLTTALEEMQGATKDAITEFIANTIKPFVEESVPSAIAGCAKLLEGNRSAFENMDAELAKALSK